MPKQYAIVILFIVGGLGSVATVTPQYAAILTGVAAVLSSIVGQIAHNANPPAAKS